ncbi:MAG: Yip1 family protein [Bacteroidota bacterium]
MDHNKNIKLTDKEIFTQIWLSPRFVFKYINENHYDKYVFALLFLAGISRALDRASMKDMGDKMSLFVILGMSIVLGGLLGWISFYIYSALLNWTGKWLDAEGNTDAILRILAYAMLPSIVGLLFFIPPIAIYGNEMFKADGDIINAGLYSNIVVYGSIIIEAILSIWTIVLVVVGISEVQKLSIGKSILNILLPSFIILVPILLIVLIIQAF